MKIFHCDHCDQLVFFENFQCIKCGRALAYVPDLADIQSLEPAGNNLWKPAQKGVKSRNYRLCENYLNNNVCNWAVPAGDPKTLCQSCRLTRVIPNLDQPEYKEAWFKLEIAKRRLVYTLMYLKLPLMNRVEDPKRGLAFEFLADSDIVSQTQNEKPAPVFTGHNNGVITINIAEADDAEREKRRQQMHEPYRTLLGHFRHEVGHYYWDRLVKDSEFLDPFHKLFGDERLDYAQSLKNYYAQGAPADWQQQFVSTYASSHPWEDWAETWAHYLHIVDTLETAAACGLSLRPFRKDEPTLKKAPEPGPNRNESFGTMVDNWFPLTYMMNNLNRGLGLPDGYPFVLSFAVIDKLHFIHDMIAKCIQQPLQQNNTP
jgi:hypothetical protein